jgi:hypothetical protein
VRRRLSRLPALRVAPTASHAEQRARGALPAAGDDADAAALAQETPRYGPAALRCACCAEAVDEDYAAFCDGCNEVFCDACSDEYASCDRCLDLFCDGCGPGGCGRAPSLLLCARVGRGCDSEWEVRVRSAPGALHAATSDAPRVPAARSA